MGTNGMATHQFAAQDRVFSADNRCPHTGEYEAKRETAFYRTIT
jgi:nitrite reductase/ring-hydroxylating ferredoxin subunit